MNGEREPLRLLDPAATTDPLLREALSAARATAPSTAQLEAIALKVAATGASPATLAAAVRHGAAMSKLGVVKLGAALVIAIAGAAAWLTLQVEQPPAIPAPPVPPQASTAAPQRERDGAARDRAPVAAQAPARASAPPATSRIDAAAPASGPLPGPSTRARQAPPVRSAPAARRARANTSSMPAPRTAPVPAAGAKAASEPSAVRSADAPSPIASSTPATQSDAPPELMLLSRTQNLLARDPEAALEVIAQHERLYAQGQFAEEREALAIDALRRLDRHQEAQARARAFLQRYPGSPPRSHPRMAALSTPRSVMRKALPIALLLVAACSRDVSTGRRLPDAPDQPAGTAGSDWGNAPDDRGAAAGTGSLAVGDNALSVRVEDIAGLEIEVVTLACAGDCAEVTAVARGGNPPYRFAWDDGGASAARTVCLDASATLQISVTDTAIEDVEFPYPAHTATADLTARVLRCTDGGAGDAGSCDPVVTQQEELTPDIFGTPTYFSDGATLAAGRYRVAYADGCMKYDAYWTWTVQGAPNFEFVLIEANAQDVLAVLPGTEAPIAFGVTGYADFDECVAANRALPPLDFDFAGGQLGIWQNDFKPEDNSAGPMSPTWRLSRLDPCP